MVNEKVVILCNLKWKKKRRSDHLPNLYYGICGLSFSLSQINLIKIIFFLRRLPSFGLKTLLRFSMLYVEEEMTALKELYIHLRASFSRFLRESMCIFH